MTDTLELTAKRIADQGRDALLARLRPAFADAASAHAGSLQLDDEQLEQMVQRAADRADGLQWRRALATVASEELGIGLGEALGHPAVERAQAIVGAPSYEDGLAALEARSDAPVPHDRRAKATPSRAAPMQADDKPARLEPEPTRARPARPESQSARPESQSARPESQSARPQSQPTRAQPPQSEPEPTRIVPAEYAPDQPQPRVRRIERPPAKQPPEPTSRRDERELTQTSEPTVTRIERKPVSPESEATRVDQQAPQSAPEGRRTAETVPQAQPKPTSAAAQAGPGPAPGSITPRPKPQGAPDSPSAAAAGAAARRPAPRRVGPSAPPPGPEGLRVAAIHLGGVTNLKPGESEIELRLSEHGLDIARASGEIIGRLGWDEIHGIEIPPPRGLLWRRRSPRSHLVVRADRGDASFEIPSVYPEELAEHLEPVLERYGRRLSMR